MSTDIVNAQAGTLLAKIQPSLLHYGVDESLLQTLLSKIENIYGVVNRLTSASFTDMLYASLVFDVTPPTGDDIQVVLYLCISTDNILTIKTAPLLDTQFINLYQAPLG